MDGRLCGARSVREKKAEEAGGGIGDQGCEKRKDINKQMYVDERVSAPAGRPYRLDWGLYNIRAYSKQVTFHAVRFGLH